MCDVSLLATCERCSVACIVQNVLSEVSSIIVTQANEDVRLITRLTGRYSLWSEAKLWADTLQSAVREIVMPHSFAPLTGFGTHERLKCRRVSSIINDRSNIIGKHQECFCSPAKALNCVRSDSLAGAFAVNPTFICLM